MQLSYNINIFRRVFIYFLASVCCVVFYSCTKDKAGVPDLQSSTTNCDSVTYKYNETIKGIISTNCLGCHSAGSPSGNLSTYSNVSAYAQSGALIGSLKGQGYTQMPPTGKLSDCDIKGIQNWVAAGANDD